MFTSNNTKPKSLNLLTEPLLKLTFLIVQTPMFYKPEANRCASTCLACNKNSARREVRPRGLVQTSTTVKQ